MHQGIGAVSCSSGHQVWPWEQYSLLTGDSIFNLCHISKVGSIWDAQTPHAMSMTPLLEEREGNVKCETAHTALPPFYS